MNQTELFDKIKYLQKYLDTYRQGIYTEMNTEDIEILKQVYSVIRPGERINVGCGGCIIERITHCVSYYEVNAPKVEPVVEKITKSRKKK